MQIPLIDKINSEILNPLIILMFAIALVYFIWGVVEFISASDSDDGRKKGQQHMLWGIIGLFIMVAAFGIMNVICETISCR